MEMKPLPVEIQGGKITLKKHSLALAQTMFDYVDADRVRLQVFLPWVEFTKTVQDEIEYIKTTQQKWEECSLFDYGIFLKENNTYVGNIGVHTISWNHNRAELGYWILGKYEGQGLISDAVCAIEKTLFERKFNRIEIRCDANNLKSGNVPKRNGYTLEGTLREHRIEQERFKDTQVYAKLKREFIT